MTRSALEFDWPTPTAPYNRDHAKCMAALAAAGKRVEALYNAVVAWDEGYFDQAEDTEEAIVAFSGVEDATYDEICAAWDIYNIHG